MLKAERFRGLGSGAKWGVSQNWGVPFLGVPIVRV